MQKAKMIPLTGLAGVSKVMVRRGVIVLRKTHVLKQVSVVTDTCFEMVLEKLNIV